jgi:hypothetical protein
MPEYNWQLFLEAFSRLMLKDNDIRGSLPPEAVAANWLGYPGASLEELDELESRLKVHMPPSYRSFLQITNGWRNAGAFIYRLWPTSQVTWFRERHQDWIDAYNPPAVPPRAVPDSQYFIYDDRQDPVLLRGEYLKTTLEISDAGDAAILLLNPRVLTLQGEWEAWFLANWLPGARRYRSFWDLMHGLRDELASLKT